jgi:putative MATE family efflux protein
VINLSDSILGKENIHTLFLKYSIPAVLGMLFVGINTIVDGFFVGNYIGDNALASVNIAVPFFSLMIALSVIIGIGTQSIIGRSLGEKNSKAANDAFRTSISLIVGISFPLAVLAVIYPKPVAVSLGANENLLPLVVTYIRYVGLSLPLLGIMFVLDYVLKLMEKPIYSMQILVVAVITHMLLNYLFIVRMGFGLRGAALATGFGYGIAFVMSIIPFVTGGITLRLFEGKFEKTLACSIFYIGIAEGVSEIGTGVTTFLFNITLMRYIGEAGVAAFSAISYLSFVANNMMIGLADGVGAIISYNYGSGEMERVKKVVKLAGISALSIGISLFLVVIIYNRELIALFLEDRDDNALNFAVHGAKLYAFAFLVNGLNIVASGYFTAICNPQNSVLIVLSKGIVWIAVGVVLLPKIVGIQGIWLTVPLAEMLTLMLSATLFYRHCKDRCQEN